MCFTESGKSLCKWQRLYSVSYVSCVLQNRFSPEEIVVSEMAVDMQAGKVRGMGHKGWPFLVLSKIDLSSLNGMRLKLLLCDCTRHEYAAVFLKRHS